MSINSSANVSVYPGTFPSLYSPVYMTCEDSVTSRVIYTTYALINILFLFPLYIFILYMGFKQWRQRYSAPAGLLASHSDFFTFNMMVVELVGVLDSSVFTLASFMKNETVLMLGTMLFNITIPGQILFHVLTSVDRYLAVVHPIAYMHLRESFGVRVRNITTVCAWLVSFGWLGLAQINGHNTFYSFTALVGVCTCVSMFCCVSVIRVLTHPGPGEVGRCNDRVDQSKQRALNIITAITAVLLLRFVGLVVSFTLQNLLYLNQSLLCPFLDSGVWLLVPSSLVLPLLFLHRAGKLSCCRSGTESG